MAIIPKLKGMVLNGNIVLDYNDKIKQQKWLQSLNGKRIEMISDHLEQRGQSRKTLITGVWFLKQYQKKQDIHQKSYTSSLREFFLKKK